jgi:hypothetical protein
VFPEGNYNATNFSDAFKTKMESKGYDATITLDPVDGRYLFESDTAVTLLPSYAYTFMGILPSNTVTATSDGVKFDFSANFLGVTQLKLFSKAFAGKNKDSKSLARNNLLTVIPINAPAYGQIDFNNNQFEIVYTNKTISGIDISFTDANNNLIDFNYVGWSLTLCLSDYIIVDVQSIVNQPTFKDYLKHPPLAKQKDIDRSVSTTKKTESQKPLGDKDLAILS